MAIESLRPAMATSRISRAMDVCKTPSGLPLIST